MRDRGWWALHEALAKTMRTARADSELMGSYLSQPEAWCEVRRVLLPLRGHHIMHNSNHPLRPPDFVGFIPSDDVWSLWPVPWKDGLALVNELVGKGLNKLCAPLDLVRYEIEAWVNVEVSIADWRKVFLPDVSAPAPTVGKRKTGPESKGDAIVAAFHAKFPHGRPPGMLKRKRDDILREFLRHQGHLDVFDPTTFRDHLRDIDP
jgi:hypothetical protein